MKTDDFVAKIRKIVKYEFKKRGFKSIRKFAEFCNVSHSTMHGIMNDRNDLRLSTLIEISNALEFDIIIVKRK